MLVQEPSLSCLYLVTSLLDDVMPSTQEIYGKQASYAFLLSITVGYGYGYGLVNSLSGTEEWEWLVGYGPITYCWDLFPRVPDGARKCKENGVACRGP